MDDWNSSSEISCLESILFVASAPLRVDDVRSQRGPGVAYPAGHGDSSVFDVQEDHAGLIGSDLEKLRRDLLVALGRRKEAFEAAWAAFRAHPSAHSYAAMDASKCADIQTLVQLLTETGELANLAAVVRRAEDAELGIVSHYIAEPAARALERSSPEAAARLWAAQGLRILRAKLSRHYDAALADFERARCCYETAGLLAEWLGVVAVVREEHRRKVGFMGGFEEVMEGGGPSKKPSFLESAKANWKRTPGD